MYPWLKCWADCSAHWHKHPPASHLAGQKSFHTGTVNLHQYSQLCPCSRLCPLNNSLPVYFIPPEIRASSYPCRPTHWVAAQHSRVTSASSLQGHRRVAYSIRQIWAKKFNLLSSGWFQLSSLFPLHLLHLCIFVSVRILHQCDVMMNGRPTKRGRGGEREGERKSDLSSAFLSLYFIMEITSFTPSTSPFISYCHWQNPFSICTSAVCVCVRVSMSQCARESQERGEKQQARCICTWAVAIMNSDCRSVNNSKQTHYVGIFCYVLLTDWWFKK